AQPNGSSLVFFDAQKRDRVSLNFVEGNLDSGLTLLDERGRIRAILSTNPKGDEPGLFLYRGDGKEEVALSATPEDGGRIQLRVATSKSMALLDAFGSGANLSLWDSQGDVRAQLLVDHDAPVFTLSDIRGAAAFEHTPGEGGPPPGLQ